MAEDRLALLCAQQTYTGVDFVAVQDPEDQTVLRVYFLLDPTTVAWVDPVLVTSLRIWAPSGGRSVVEPEILSATWKDDGLGTRTYLEVIVDQPGDFSLYRFSIDDSAHVDYHFSTVDFSFKQACPTTLDCKLATVDESCPEEDDELELNPLARDFVSLRRALLDYAAQKYPSWTYRSEADVGVMLIEVMAALGDELNYIKDRFAREGVLDELSQRRSLRHILRLFDYELHDGRSPGTVLELDVNDPNPTIEVAAGTRVWAQRLGESPITFEIGEGIADYRTDEFENPRTFTLSESWNTLTVYEPDGAKPKLAKGATELFVLGTVGSASWVTEQRMLVLHEDPSDGSEPKRHLVHVTERQTMADALTLDNVTRLAWSEDEALECPMVLADMTVKANVVPATAGETFEEYFSVRGDGTVTDVVEREGPLDAITGTRNPLFRYSPSECEARGLGWLGEIQSSSPEIEMQTVDGVDEPESQEWNLNRAWTWRRTLLDSTPDDQHFTIEDGTWRRIIAYRKGDGTEVVHRDWAANAGYTLRFGDGEFGQIPADDTIFRVRYRSGPGSSANLAADTIVHLVHPVDGGSADDPRLVAVNNPFDVVDGVDPEDMQRAKFLGPDAFRHDDFYAVTPADYERFAETLEWVEQANATFRWTGSWLTIFVAADPVGSFELTSDQHGELEDLMDRVRQVGRDVHVVPPDYIDLDVRVEIRLEPGYYAGQVEVDILEALTGDGGFFAPENFSFGIPLRRSPLVARIQGVEGVCTVEEIRLRAREKTGWFEFDESEFQVGSGQIIRTANDTTRPELGTVVVQALEVV